MRAWSVVAAVATASIAVLSILVLGACSRGGGSASNTTPTSAAASPASDAARVACTADELGPLDNNKMYQECADTEDACRAACERDDVEACFGLAIVEQQRAMETESPDAPGYAEASNALYRKACLLGAPNACTNHAAHLWRFSRDRADLSCAQRLFDATCELEDPFGCGMAGRLLIDHAASPEHDEISQGRALLERSCLQLGGFPCHVLALYFEQGKLGAVPAGRIELLMKQACDGGVDQACGEYKTVEETFRVR